MSVAVGHYDEDDDWHVFNRGTVVDNRKTPIKWQKDLVLIYEFHLIHPPPDAYPIPLLLHNKLACNSQLVAGLTHRMT